MQILITDEEIDALLKEPKKLQNIKILFNPKFTVKKGHKESALEIKCSNESKFMIILRQNLENTIDFSVILGYVPKGQTKPFHLRRYNGKSHEHTNHFEKKNGVEEMYKFYNFHIHQATLRYQQSGFSEEGYATPTDRYSDINGAIKCLIEDCNIIYDNKGENLILLK